MKSLILIFFKIPSKIFHIIFYKWEYLYYRFFYKKPVLDINYIHNRYLIAGNDDFDIVIRTYRKLFPDRLKIKNVEAELICMHIFDILGSGSTKLSSSGQGYQPIDWHSDFKSKHYWDQKKFYKNIGYGHKLGIDIKVPWELCRFQHLNVLGQAYILTKNKKYADEFKNQIEDWINNNAVGFGVNWRCTMDVAIRAANWLVAQEFFQDKNILAGKFWLKFYTSIYEHGKFIRSHLEDHGLIRNNHYIADLVGLFFIAVYCPFYKESGKWKKYALKHLAHEVEEQIYPDGCSFEASTSYQRLVLELLFYTELLAYRAGIDLPDEYKNRVRKMFEFSLHCIKPNGKIPQIGDNDNGRFLIFSKRPILEHKYLLKFAAIHYRDSQFKLSDLELDEEAFWIFGKSDRELYDKIPLRGDKIPSKSFANAGWFVIRDGSEYCFVSCGSNGQNGNGGHSHNDKLSFELVIDGNDVIVDPGTYTYTAYPKIRNKFRSTAYHNTFVCNNYEQNKITTGLMFSLPQETKIINAHLLIDDKEIRFQGEIKYGEIRHKRAIIYNKSTKEWKIHDSLASKNPVSARSLFHLSPELTISENIILRKMTNERIMSIETGNYNLENEIYEYSPKYGRKMEALCVFFNARINEKPKLFTTILGS